MLGEERLVKGDRLKKQSPKKEYIYFRPERSNKLYHSYTELSNLFINLLASFCEKYPWPILGSKTKSSKHCMRKRKKGMMTISSIVKLLMKVVFES